MTRGGYTLAEILVAAVIIGVTMSAAVSLSTTLKMQEELSWRVAVACNYHENAARLWQMGQTATDVSAAMPSTSGNPFLNDILDTTATTTTQVTADKAGFGTMESAISTVQVGSFSSTPGAGAVTTLRAYRPSMRGTAQ